MPIRAINYGRFSINFRNKSAIKMFNYDRNTIFFSQAFACYSQTLRIRISCNSYNRLFFSSFCSLSKRISTVSTIFPKLLEAFIFCLCVIKKQ